MTNHIEDADIVVDISGGRLAAQQYRDRIDQLQAELAAEKKAVETLTIFFEDAKTQIRNGIDRWQAEKEKNRWIPVGERLPDAQQHVLLVCKGRNFSYVRMGYRSVPFPDEAPDVYGWYLITGPVNQERTQLQITHWRPIHLPEEDEEGL